MSKTLKGKFEEKKRKAYAQMGKLKRRMRVNKWLKKSISEKLYRASL